MKNFFQENRDHTIMILNVETRNSVGNDFVQACDQTCTSTGGDYRADFKSKFLPISLGPYKTIV